MTTKLVKCTCIHPYQDKLYGIGNRVANKTQSGQLRCTVCEMMHGSQSMTQSEKISAKVAAKESNKESKTTKGGKTKTIKKKRSLKGGKR